MLQLPHIVLPTIDLPFDIPLLSHPIVVHFVIVLPLVVLLLEMINLVVQKKSISAVSFFLILLTVVVSAGAYLTGVVDAKEAYITLSEMAKEELAEHKLLGTYLLLVSGLLLIMKLLSSLTGYSVVKFLYFVVLVALIALTLKQGEEGGELVYEYGVNVQEVQLLKERLSDTNHQVKPLPKDDTQAQTLKVATPPLATTTPTAVDTTPASLMSMPKVPSLKSLPTLEQEKFKSLDESNQTLLDADGMPKEMIQPKIATH